MTSEQITVKSEGMTLARVVWQFLKRQPAGYVERVMEANPGLASSLELPIGTVVTLPLDDIPASSQTRNIIKLWD